MKDIAWARMAYGTASAIASFFIARSGKDWIVGNTDAVNLIATVFSVLAGFLIAIMAVVADERMIATKGSRVRYLETKNIRSRLERHSMLFQLYLVVMVLAFVATLKIDIPTAWSSVLHQAMLGLAVFAFLLSFRLPAQITAEYLRRLDEIDKSK